MYKVVNLSKLRIIPTLLVSLGLAPYSNSITSSKVVPEGEACICCTDTNTCEVKNNCNPAPSSSKDSCPCPPKCGANQNTGSPSIYLESKGIKTELPPFSVTRTALTNTKYEYRSYKPPTPPPKR
jgi:hypothetical protein